MPYQRGSSTSRCCERRSATSTPTAAAVHTTPHHTTPHHTTPHDTTHDTTRHHTTPHDTTQHEPYTTRMHHTPHTPRTHARKHARTHANTPHDNTRHHTTPQNSTCHANTVRMDATRMHKRTERQATHHTCATSPSKGNSGSDLIDKTSRPHGLRLL
jgi:hypothetical protein